MDFLNTIWSFLHSDAGLGVLLGLLGISEALASIPRLQANSVLQLVIAILKKVAVR